MFKAVNSKVNFPALEEGVLAFWKQHDIFRKSVAQREGSPPFIMFEGPPTANGMPGIHHVLARVFKDVIPRYKTMQGFQAPRKGGWDTHGLPVELEVERELGLASKREIEEYGIERFNQKCRESVFRYVKEWENLTDRIGFWIDIPNAYVTFRNDYIETGWWIIKQLWDKGLVYLGNRTTPHCPRCGTSLSSHEVALGYNDETVDPSVYVKFRLAAHPGGGRHPGNPEVDRLLSAPETPATIMAWTTTPWTLPGNTALAVAPEADYVVADTATGRVVLARTLAEQALKGEEYTIAGTVKGSDLVGHRYHPLFDPVEMGFQVQRFGGAGSVELTNYQHPDGEALTYPVVAGEFVLMDDGTGVVHIAPAFGADDFELGKSEGLFFVQHVDLKGEIQPCPKEFAGMFVKQADPLIMRDLRERGLVHRVGTITHTYPFCWRCNTPLLYYVKTSWYIRTTMVKQQLVDGNARIHWYPAHIREGRFGDWLDNNVDWAISRERYWGTPLPVWQCERCGAHECIGGRAELAAKPGVRGLPDGLDLHRPFVDAVLFDCTACGAPMRRVSEVLDAWFDSGAMPYAQWHYPFENQETFKTWFPADYICEGVDQTRGWFYTLHALATLLHAAAPESVGDSIAYQHVISLGHILDGKGEKMSKSKGNVVDPWSVLNNHGADALRWYLYTASPAGNPRRFSVDLVGESLRKFLLTLWNTYSFFVTYANIDGYDPTTADGPLPYSDLDRWIRSELHTLVEEVTTALEAYNPTDAGRRIQEFVDGLSNWYVRRSRRRFWKSENDGDKFAAYDTLYTCLTTLSKLLAPFTPFVAEELYQNLVRSVDANALESVHLTQFPEPDYAEVDETLNRDTKLVMRMVSLGRAARSKAAVKVRQPLGTVYLSPRTEQERAVLDRLRRQVEDELNVKAVVVGDPPGLDRRFATNDKVLGPKYGDGLRRIKVAVARATGAERAGWYAAYAAGQPVLVRLDDGREAALSGDELNLIVEIAKPWVLQEERGYVVAVDSTVTPALKREGLARELVHSLQTMRRTADFDIADAIQTELAGVDDEIVGVVEFHGEYIKQETLSRSIGVTPATAHLKLTTCRPNVIVEGGDQPGAYSEDLDMDGHRFRVTVRRL
ncbi:MAG: isoleucine--tRNA ligase [Dehalococcoidia bacterium]|nr:isoleucine--tRNA ligase [Dehalococcoidia bacterium]